MLFPHWVQLQIELRWTEGEGRREVERGSLGWMTMGSMGQLTNPCSRSINIHNTQNQTRVVCDSIFVAGFLIPPTKLQCHSQVRCV
uniref:Uncharacterized protein n=1 Tax=Rhizophora mucronata TaxID=61149 RepID=A0A2P2NJ27_RHIMU